jgi:hypothetical protein
LFHIRYKDLNILIAKYRVGYSRGFNANENCFT